MESCVLVLKNLDTRPHLCHLLTSLYFTSLLASKSLYRKVTWHGYHMARDICTIFINCCKWCPRSTHDVTHKHKVNEIDKIMNFAATKYSHY